MSSGSRALTIAYTCTALWLAWCALQQYRYGALWVAPVFGAASLMPVIAVVRETVIAEERHTVAALCEQDARRRAQAEPLPDDGPPLDPGEQAAWRDIAGHWDDRSAA